MPPHGGRKRRGAPTSEKNRDGGSRGRRLSPGVGFAAHPNPGVGLLRQPPRRYPRGVRVPGLELSVGDPDALPWRTTRHPGVSWLPLHPPDGSAARGTSHGARGESAVLIRMDPGRGYPAHRHLGVEEVLILAGGYRDAGGEHQAGSYLRYEVGSEHAPVALGDGDRPPGPTNPACILFAIARAGVQDL